MSPCYVRMCVPTCTCCADEGMAGLCGLMARGPEQAAPKPMQELGERWGVCVSALHGALQGHRQCRPKLGQTWADAGRI